MFKIIIALLIIIPSFAFSHDEEKYTSDGGYKIKSTNKNFVKIHNFIMLFK